MDVAGPEQLQFLSIWGLVRESVKLIRSHGKLFLALTMTFMLPRYIIHVGDHLIAQPILNRIVMVLSRSPSQLTSSGPDLLRELGKLLKVSGPFFVASVAFSLLSTAAIAYNIACIYSNRTTSYEKVLNFVPRVLKRVVLTFFWAISIMFISPLLYTILIVIVAAVLDRIFQVSGVVIIVVVFAGMVVGLLVGVLYFVCVLPLARVVTVLEKDCGLGAMRKSLHLIQGKRFAACCLYFINSTLVYFISLGFRTSVVQAMSNSVVWKTFFGCAFILLMSIADLIGFVLQTVFYLACKAHHHESIDTFLFRRERSYERLYPC